MIAILLSISIFSNVYAADGDGIGHKIKSSVMELGQKANLRKKEIVHDIKLRTRRSSLVKVRPKLEELPPFEARARKQEYLSKLHPKANVKNESVGDREILVDELEKRKSVVRSERRKTVLRAPIPSVRRVTGHFASVHNAPLGPPPPLPTLPSHHGPSGPPPSRPLPSLPQEGPPALSPMTPVSPIIIPGLHREKPPAISPLAPVSPFKVPGVD